jgi:methyl-accepting chemotaxis protein
MAQLNIRNTLIASFGTVAAIAVLLGGATFVSTGGGGEHLDASQVAFVESLARVEGELTTSVADLVARNGAEWPASLDEAFQGFADAAGSTDITAFGEQVNTLLQSGQEFRSRWPAAVNGDAAAVDAATFAYRDTTAAIHQLETMLVGDRMTAGAGAAGLAGLLRLLALGGTAACVGLAGFACWYCIKSILGPLKVASDIVAQAAAGNLTVRIGDAAGDGEIGALCGSIDGLLNGTHQAMSGVMQESFKLAASATNLAANAQMLTQGAENLANDATQAAGSAESVSTNMTTMAASAEEMTINLQSIAASATQLTKSIQAINDNAETASAAADNAAALAADSNGKVSHLGNAADEIGKVIEVIQDIAEQTNLLALNATIEAARAGEAGKGFAVVATEVKELAKQTGDATEDIRQRIEAIQASTGESVEAIGRISDVIAEISSVAKTIATAVEQQNGATQEIARNVGESATAAESVSGGVAQSAGASEEISRNIANVDKNTRESVDSLQIIQSASQDVAQMAEALNGQVSNFTM